MFISRQIMQLLILVININNPHFLRNLIFEEKILQNKNLIIASYSRHFILKRKDVR